MPAVDRLLRVAIRLGTGDTVTIAYIQERFGVSLATAKRDMDRIASALPVVHEAVPGDRRNGIPRKALRLMPRAQLLAFLRETP